MFTILGLAGCAEFSFCFAVRERRLRSVALADQKRQTETDPNYILLRLAQENAIDPRALLEKSTLADVVKIDVAVKR